MIRKEERTKPEKYQVAWYECDGCGFKAPEERMERPTLMQGFKPDRPKDFGAFAQTFPQDGYVPEVKDLCGACGKRVNDFIKALRSTK